MTTTSMTTWSDDGTGSAGRFSQRQDGGHDQRGDGCRRFPSRHLPRPTVREMPGAPQRYWRLIGPGIIAAGVGLASGEFILFPYIASQVGLVFVWAALLGLITSSS